jgi:hypothetical protein
MMHDALNLSRDATLRLDPCRNLLVISMFGVMTLLQYSREKKK